MPPPCGDLGHATRQPSRPHCRGLSHATRHPGHLTTAAHSPHQALWSLSPPRLEPRHQAAQPTQGRRARRSAMPLRPGRQLVTRGVDAWREESVAAGGAAAAAVGALRRRRHVDAQRRRGRALERRRAHRRQR
eukprot:363965-Chlamydomonas_euryale.AAC.21